MLPGSSDADPGTSLIPSGQAGGQGHSPETEPGLLPSWHTEGADGISTHHPWSEPQALGRRASSRGASEAQGEDGWPRVRARAVRGNQGLMRQAGVWVMSPEGGSENTEHVNRCLAGVRNQV